MNKKAIIAISRKEFFNFINNASGYVIVVPFLIISFFLYFRIALVSNEASLRPFFELFPWLLLFLIPAIAMRLIPEEKKSGTLELLFSHPLTELEIVIAKFLGGLAIFLLVLLLTLTLPITLFVFSKPDLGIIVSQYLGAIFSGAAFLALSLAVSVYFETAISSFLAASAVSFLFILSGLDIFVLMLPFPFDRIVREISLLPHMQSMARGLLDFRDISYFLSLTVIFLTISSIKLAARKIRENKKGVLKLNLIFWSAFILGIGFNIIFNFYPLRLDLTKNHLFTLSQGTKQTVKKLKKEVKITLYASHNLPGTMISVFKEVKDLLKDYQSYSNKFKLEIKYTDNNQKITKEAVDAGVQEVSFNRVGTQKFEVQNGFLGLLISSGGKKEVIPFVEKTSDLEYQLTKKIRKISTDKEQQIGWFSNDYLLQYSQLKKTLENQYKIKSLDLNNKKEELKDLSALVYIDNASQEEATAASKLKQYLNGSGRLLVLTKGESIDSRSLSVSKTKSSIGKVLADYGLVINEDLVYDLQLNEAVAFGQGNIRYFIPYPFWLKAIPSNDNFSVLNNVKSVSLAWPSSLKIEKKEGVIYHPLLETGLRAGKQENNFTLAPSAVKSLKTSLEKFLLALALEKGNARLAVVSDYNFCSDKFVQNNSDNLALAVNLIDWLAANKDLAAVPIKTSGRPVFRFSNSIQPMLVQYGNIFLPSFLLVVFAFFWIGRRKRLALRQH